MESSGDTEMPHFHSRNIELNELFNSFFSENKLKCGITPRQLKDLISSDQRLTDQFLAEKLNMKRENGLHTLFPRLGPCDLGFISQNKIAKYLGIPDIQQ